MFFPIRTDRRLQTTPWVNYALIGANLAVFLITYNSAAGSVDPRWGGFWLDPQRATVQQHLTYQFFHASWMHLLGNMLFLFVFGNSVEDRLGHSGYLLFYLAGGVMAGIGHGLTSSAPVLGASGSVAAVTGAYLVFFPLTNVTIFYWFVIFGAFEVSSIILILFRIGQDFVFALADVGRVAYTAHLAGYAFGFVIGMAILLSRLLAREPYDLLALIERKRRRSQLKTMNRRGDSPWESAGVGGSDRGRRGRQREQQAPEPTSAEQQALMDRRSAISQALAGSRIDEAARLYGELLDDHPEQVMAQQQQLDLANQLMADGRHELAARAYENLLRSYPHYPQRHHVKLVLGLLYARYLNQQQRARELLEQAEPSLHDQDKTLARQVLDDLPVIPS
jgi:membrane associated rhomboid family serine protease